MSKQDTLTKNSSISKTLSQSIHSYIKEAIITNRLKANQRINEKEIAAEFGVSTTPVREAVQKLGAEGFITINSHREAVVRAVSFEELQEIFKVLSILDGQAASLAADHIGHDDLRELEGVIKEMEKSCHINSVKKYLTLNQRFHRRIWRCVPNRTFQTILYYVDNQMLRYTPSRLYAFKNPGLLESSLQEHKEMLEALRTKDKERLEELMSKHWASLLQPSPFREGLREFLYVE